MHNEERDIAADFDADFAANEKVVSFCCKRKGCEQQGHPFDEKHNKTAKHLRSAGETSGDAVLLICTGPVGGSGCPMNFSTQFSSTFKRYVLLLEYTQ